MGIGEIQPLSNDEKCYTRETRWLRERDPHRASITTRWQLEPIRPSKGKLTSSNMLLNGMVGPVWLCASGTRCAFLLFVRMTERTPRPPPVTRASSLPPIVLDDIARSLVFVLPLEFIEITTVYPFASVRKRCRVLRKSYEKHLTRLHRLVCPGDAVQKVMVSDVVMPRSLMLRDTGTPMARLVFVTARCDRLLFLALKTSVSPLTRLVDLGSPPSWCASLLSDTELLSSVTVIAANFSECSLLSFWCG